MREGDCFPVNKTSPKNDFFSSRKFKLCICLEASFPQIRSKMADGTQEVEQRRCQVFQVSYRVTKTSDAEALRAATGSRGFSSLTFSRSVRNRFIMTDE